MAKQFRTVYDSPYNTGFDSNAFRKVALQDPKFALGEAIGRGLADAYANNYNNRGINNAVNKALEEYGAGPNVADQQAALEQVKQNYADVQPAVSVGVNDTNALSNVRQNLGLETPQPVQPIISAGEIPATMTAAQLAQLPGAAIVAQDNASRDMGAFNAKEAMLKARQQMINDGRTPYQIAQAMEILEPHFAKMQDDSYRDEVERIMAGLQEKDTDSLDYKRAIVDMASRYGDYGKNAANLLGKDIVTGQQQWQAEQQLEREKQRATLRANEKAQDNALRERIADKKLAAYIASRSKGNGNTNGNGNRNGNRTTNVKSVLDSAEFKYMDTQVNKIAEIPDEERSPEQKRFYDHYKPLRDQIVARSFGNQFNYHTPEERGINTTSRQAGFNPNNYEQAVPYFREFAKRGNFKKEDIARYIRQRYYGLKPDDTSNEFVESIIREI